MSKAVAVMGCGWLGLPLAVSLLKNGYLVRGSTTSEEKINILKEKGIIPSLISISENGIEGDITEFLREVEILILNIPPNLRGGRNENYVQKIRLLHREISKSSVEKVVFVSSTSVYGDLEGEVTEETSPRPVTESGKQLLEAEKVFRNDQNLQTTIVRFGGLIGLDRHPIKMLSGRKNLSNGHAPINLIHLNDCIGIITQIIRCNWWNELLNGVHPSHPLKRDYYTSKAFEMGLQAPDYKGDTPKKSKIIVSKVLQSVKKYEFTTTL